MFRGQLLLEEQRRLYDVWASAAGALTMPTRESFQPRAFGALLPFISLVEVKPCRTASVRVAGSALRDVFGDDPKTCLSERNYPGAADTITRMISDCRPVCGVAPITNGNGSQGVRFWLRLPLGLVQELQAVIGLDIALCGARAPEWALQKMASA